MTLLTATHIIPQKNLAAFEAIADTFGCALDIHAPEDCPQDDITLTWVIPADELTWIETALEKAQDENDLTFALTWTEVETNIDWQAKVAANFPPLPMGSFYITRNNETPPAGTIPLAIPANQAFGSGEHATTAGCLALFEALYMQDNPRPEPAKILDMGAGSGLLAMAAAKIYPDSLNVATDIDPTSVNICADNCAINNVPHIVCAAGTGFNLPAAQDNAPFNLIFANILMNPLLDMAEDLVNALDNNGIAILSGFTPEQHDTITQKYTALGLTPLMHTQQTQETSMRQGIPCEWIAAAFIHQNT